jgi:hypothetical protein
MKKAWFYGFAWFGIIGVINIWFNIIDHQLHPALPGSVFRLRFAIPITIIAVVVALWSFKRAKLASSGISELDATFSWIFGFVSAVFLSFVIYVGFLIIFFLVAVVWKSYG